MNIFIVGNVVRSGASEQYAQRIVSCFFIKNFKNEMTEEIVYHEDLTHSCKGLIFEVASIKKIRPNDGEVMDVDISEDSVIMTHPYFAMTSDTEITFMTEDEKRVFLEI